MSRMTWKRVPKKKLATKRRRRRSSLHLVARGGAQWTYPDAQEYGSKLFLAVLVISKRPVHQGGLSPVHQGRAWPIISSAEVEAPPESRPARTLQREQRPQTTSTLVALK
jgi:hypothetical protein